MASEIAHLKPSAGLKKKFPQLGSNFLQLSFFSRFGFGPTLNCVPAADLPPQLRAFSSLTAFSADAPEPASNLRRAFWLLHTQNS